MARSQGAWLKAVEDHCERAGLRADAREHLRALAWGLAAPACWVDMSTRPTWELLQHRSGLSRRSVARWLAWLREAGLLGVAETGSTPAFRPMALAGLDGNRAALYVLAVPPKEPDRPEEPRKTSTSISGTPTKTFSEGLTDPDTGAHEVQPQPNPLRGPDRPQADNYWPWTEAATRRSERLALARRLQAELPVLRRLSDRRLRHLLRPWLVARWTAADVLYALDHDPGGAPRTWTTRVHSPGGWVRSRMTAWQDPSGVSLPPVSAAAAARHAQLQAVQRQRGEQAAQVTEQADRAQRWSGLIAEAVGQGWSRLEAAAVAPLRPRPRSGGPMTAALVRRLVLAALPPAVADPGTGAHGDLPDPGSVDLAQVRAAVARLVA